ncbi:YaiI/YqxD family protein [Selenomonas ruminantium]|uniref:YaiI/YqxD family protein n=1 Tax=Selenomonas ruminantium TaxID=971 RepID=UPI0003F7200F|nr:YaiI/YqxD family protein [Selenomonas ruminantium]
MRIYVDADACPVVKITEQVARKYGLPVTLLCDTNHILTSVYSEVRVIGAGADAVDLALINLCQAGDIVVTQDYGVAAMALGKKAYAIHQNGWRYTAENIDRLLMERHMAKKARRSKKKVHLKGPAKRTEEDDDKFAAVFRRRCWREKGTNNCCPEGLLPRFDGKV